MPLQTEISLDLLPGQVTTELGTVGLNPRGEYSGPETYNRLDIVQYGGSGWICLQDGTTGMEPTEGDTWMRFADNGSASAVESARSYAEQAQQAQQGAESARAETEGYKTEAQEAAGMATEKAGQAQTAQDAATKAQGAAEAAQNAAEQAAVNPPRINDESSTWETWTQGTGYEDTGKPSKGDKGPQGDPGFSPTVDVKKDGKVTTITITDAGGPHVATINDGLDGTGTGDMIKATYDPSGREKDIFASIDDKQDKLSGAEGQVVGFGAEGVIEAVDAMVAADIDTIWTEVFGNG